MNWLIFIILLISGFIIFWGMIGYKFSLRILEKIFPVKEIKTQSEYFPTVAVMVVAHNEEKVIQEKLDNLINNNYPKDKIEYVIASDNSTDLTNQIVEKFIKEHRDIKIRLYVTKEHLGKTNAQNEAQKIIKSEILVMTDANSMFCEDTVSQLVKWFADETIAYVAGKLCYKNSDENETANAENTYWEGDLKQREIESKISCITAGNGAVYACRNSLYYDFPNITCHDAQMPQYFAKKKLRAVYNPKAVAYEKAGENSEDEFKRKVRMGRNLATRMVSDWQYINPFKYRWFAYFYFGHRFCRHYLWLAHILLLISSFLLGINISGVGKIVLAVAFWGQVLFYFIALLEALLKTKKKIIYMVYYYTMTIVAQMVAVFKFLTGKSKATWEKAESTR